MPDPTVVTSFMCVMGGITAALAGLRYQAALLLPTSAAEFTEEQKQALRKTFRPHAKTLFAEDLAALNKKDLLTGNEREFYGRICRALPEHTVLAQVAMGALIEVDQALADQEFAVREKFARKIVDFVVCDRQMRVVALIELDDRTHDAEKDRARDAMTAAAGYRTLRWDSRAKPTEAQIRAEVLAPS